MNFRTIDGSDNNLLSPDLNAAGTDFTRLGPAHFADGVSTPVDGPNPRMVSNVVVGSGDADVQNPEGLSGMMYAWGQFIDHDLDLSPSDGTTHIDITIPPDDASFPPGTVIPLTRAVTDPASGTDAAHPAIAVNAITGWLDGSMVYGSDEATASSLRLADGHMKISAGGNLPIVDGMFAAGDVRAAENPSLTALQTLFVREHNYQVDQLHKADPTLSGDQLYDEARAIVTAEIAHITYAEFLPHLLGPDAIAPYHGYDPTVDPRISVEFAGAAYRFGHSIVSAETEKIGEQGQSLEPTRDLKDVFFEPPAQFSANSGADGILRHLASDASQALDVHIVDDLRNFLVDPPDGQDLAAINIARGRDLGLGTLNETRAAIGLAPYADFDQITHDATTAAALKQAFGSVDKVDLWTGGLAEDHAPGAFVGPTFQAIIATQFETLRDGDRLWYENQGFDAETLSRIEHTTLSDIIERDTGTGHLQDDAFVFYDRHSGTKGGIAADHPEAPQLVIGSNGRDTLVGGAHDDILVAGKGEQTMTGLAGADKFVFGQHGINARITDFDPGEDKIEIDHAGTLSLDEMHVAYEHGNAVIQVAGDRIELVGVQAHQLSAEDFVFRA
jgi:peroxidase